MASSRKLILEFIGVFVIGALAGGLLAWSVIDTHLTTLMSHWTNPDKLAMRIDQKYADQFHLTPQEVNDVKPVTHEMAQHLYQVRRQFNVDILSTLDQYHAAIGEKLTPEHRAAYEAAMAVRRKDFSATLQADASTPSDAGKK